MTDLHGTWSLNFIIGLGIAALCLLVLIAIAVVALKHLDSEFGIVWLVGALICVPILLGITACTTFPWESQYHRYEPKVGKVLAIDKRILPSGDGIEEKFAVQLDGLAGQYGCQDTRCALVRPGDMLALRCIQKWDYSATDGFDCRFVAHEKETS